MITVSLVVVVHVSVTDVRVPSVVAGVGGLNNNIRITDKVAEKDSGCPFNGMQPVLSVSLNLLTLT